MEENELVIKYVGKLDPKRHLSEELSKLMKDNIVHGLAAMLTTCTYH